MARADIRYQVIFLGPMAKDFGLVDKLVDKLQNHCNLSSRVVTKMMQLAPITVKNGIDLQEAQKYQKVLEEMGAKVKIEPIDKNVKVKKAPTGLKDLKKCAVSKGA